MICEVVTQVTSCKLWQIIKNHDEGLCDSLCSDLLEIRQITNSLDQALEWLHSKGYIKKIKSFTNAWREQPQLFQLNWEVVKQNLGIPFPPVLKPISKIEERRVEGKNNNTKKESDTLTKWF